MPVEIRHLTPDDAAVWKAFRIGMLEAVPEAFCVVADSLTNRPFGFFEHWLKEYHCFGAIQNGALIGSVAWKPNGSPVTQHRGELTAVYVAPETRGKGVLDALLKAVERDAAGRVILLELEVNAGLVATVAAYQRNGYAVIARLPDHMKHGDQIADAFRMIKRI
ncbi:MAG: N-acetyltransferase [Deltaproteobacteria bacterium]